VLQRAAKAAARLDRPSRVSVGTLRDPHRSVASGRVRMNVAPMWPTRTSTARAARTPEQALFVDARYSAGQRERGLQL
jgi:hypothetical protein